MSAPSIVEALRTFTAAIVRSEEFRTVFRDALREELAAQSPAATEMVPPREFAREHALNPATVRQMIKDGRLEAVKIGKRQWRIRRDAPIGQPLARTRKATAETPAETARRILEKLR
jgi:excisionase family DNA binding protein